MFFTNENDELCVKPIYAIPLIVTLPVMSGTLIFSHWNKVIEDKTAQMNVRFGDVNTSSDSTDVNKIQLDAVKPQVSDDDIQFYRNITWHYSADNPNTFQQKNYCITFFQSSVHVQIGDLSVSNTTTYQKFNGDCLDAHELEKYNNLSFSALTLP